MKRKRIVFVTLVLSLMIGFIVYFEACKKKTVTPINNIPAQDIGQGAITNDAAAIVGKIKRFKNQLADNECVTRDGLSMPIDSVIWNIEALFNSEYSFTDRKYLETVKQDLEFFVNINENGEVPFNIVADLYDDVIESVRQAYSDDGISVDKSLMVVDVEKGEATGNTVAIIVHVISGRAKMSDNVTTPIHDPFGPGDCWYFGEYGGTCDDPSVFCDAAEVLEDTINFYYGKTVVPATGCRSLFHDIFRVSLEGNEYVDNKGVPYIYYHDLYDNPPLNLDYEMLNYYYHRELEVLLHLLPEDPAYQGLMPSASVFMNVDIQGIIGFVGNGSCVHHKNYVVYGNKVIIPEQLLPPVRDLLN